MEYKLCCYGRYNTNCFRCLVKCPDKIKCENETILNKMQRQLYKREVVNEKNIEE